MTQLLKIHPRNPEQRLIIRAVEIIRNGGVVVFPTDSAYAIGCRLNDQAGANKIRSIRKLDENHHFTLMCKDLSEISVYANIDNVAYRLIKSHTPGPYTFLLPATKEVPKRFLHPKRKTIGIRVPDSKIIQSILKEYKEPIMSCTLILPGDEYPILDPVDIYDSIGKQIDLVIDGGACGMDATSVIDLYHGKPEVIRKGKGDISEFI
jgi:tRNA threonylcarbamoyl adenosine modification protein (Sua5/YciO/YrdC/YwlC family)